MANICGDLDDYTKRNRKETITEPWEWSVINTENSTNGNSPAITATYRGAGDNLDEKALLAPNRLEVENQNGMVQLKVFDGGNAGLKSDQTLTFFDEDIPGGVTLKELVECCDDAGSGTGSGGGFDPIAVNFKSAGVHTRQHTGRATNSSEDGTLLDVFEKEINYEEVTMPPGANAAVMFMHYGASIRPWSGVRPDTDAYGTGYANIGMNYELINNRGSLTTAPGPLAGGIRLYGDILPWKIAGTIAQGEDDATRERRTPSHTSTVQRAIRVYFDQSTETDPVTIKIQPECNIHRIRGCEAVIGSGRILIIPYHDEPGVNWRPRIDLPEFEEFDDGAPEPAFDEALESRELKNRMNYMSNAIRETLDYDQNLDPNGVPILEQALKDIFGLKQEQVNDFDYYTNRLNTISELVMPYVGFQFGFEVNNTRISF